MAKQVSASSASKPALFDVLLGEDGNGAAAHFEYDWTLKSGGQFVFQVVDCFKFGEDGGRPCRSSMTRIPFAQMWVTNTSELTVWEPPDDRKADTFVRSAIRWFVRTSAVASHSKNVCIGQEQSLTPRHLCIQLCVPMGQMSSMSIHPLPLPKPRISQKVRDAVDLRVREGLSIAAAAERAGMSRNGFAKALKRAAVQDLVREVQERFVIESEAARAVYRARAFEVALHLMENAKSETVRARMVEFLAGDGISPQVAVHVDARQKGGGYEYLRPGEEIVEIVSGKIEPTGCMATGD